ncbi:ParA family protein [Erysipelotrichaceae bacterium OttesenSCG-928-M19]|nr:ParA family protein [Erysipelotrichaceae bacterium OttesenSCG-928-M19]
MKTKIIDIANAKGGIGKTAGAVMLSRLFSIDFFKTLIISADRQCNLDSSLGYNKNEDHLQYNSTYGLMIDDNLTIDECIRPTIFENIDIILSSYNLHEIERIIYKREINDTNFIPELILKKKIDKMKSKYDFIIIDTGPKYDLLMKNSLAAANNILIPINPDLYSQDVLVLLLRDIKFIKDNFNDSLKINKIFINKYKNISSHKKIYEDLRDIFGDQFAKTVIYDRTIIKNNIELDKNSFISKSKESIEVIAQFRKLAKESGLYE